MSQGTSLYRPNDSKLAFFWHRFDRKYMKPVFSRLTAAVLGGHDGADDHLGLSPPPHSRDHTMSDDEDSISGDELELAEAMELEIRRQASFKNQDLSAVNNY
ncbi:hypothetical protein SARC_15797 [Sphaeroforma arctica JP610]|uniref:Uncharacterized protein n=1 Tax=Sphaeroforma arctica JP610 TaxID=667725 RepID=A0A0L0F4L2_9EUKA|nr:hypothetical protein SARC_15797 [Sphaeroforma arctica JP610]KNC71665.1 hypothetical protein SARC_15797 [Sphaeroforma arctica JP610]|eukprot:XP_014145567.1 hypothetical protein SARC_15797 [Sphaeroforma arctica JP610]